MIVLCCASHIREGDLFLQSMSACTVRSVFNPRSLAL